MKHPDIAILARSELFRGLPETVLAEAQATSFRKRVAAGEAVIHQGDAADSLYLVVVGRLRVTQATSEGQQVIIRYLGPGELIGYAALSGGESHPGTVTAVEDSHLMGWSEAAIRSLMTTHAGLAMNALAVLGARYREFQTRLREMSTEKVEQRIAHTILRLVERSGRRTAYGIEIAFPLSRQDLAEMTGTTLHTVSRTLSAWEARGIVASGRRRVTVRDQPTLATIAEEV
jgi:CRP-like cAMP-binding protein